MIEHTLPMDITAGEALREWSEFDAAESQAKKGALWKRYQVLAEETRKIATARARIAELSTQIKANVAA